VSFSISGMPGMRSPALGLPRVFSLVTSGSTRLGSGVSTKVLHLYCACIETLASLAFFLCYERSRNDPVSHVGFFASWLSRMHRNAI
jgi:hypothetical protein